MYKMHSAIFINIMQVEEDCNAKVFKWFFGRIFSFEPRLQKLGVYIFRKVWIFFLE